jgi:hypothetical protein
MGHIGIATRLPEEQARQWLGLIDDLLDQLQRLRADLRQAILRAQQLRAEARRLRDVHGPARIRRRGGAT